MSFAAVTASRVRKTGVAGVGFKVPRGTETASERASVWRAAVTTGLAV
jgi:hypothetical protein